MVTYSWRWLKEHLDELRNVNEIKDIEKDIFYKIKNWAPLKLIALMLYTNFYTKVASNYFKRIYFIDILADSGINRVEGKNDIIVGSPIIAARSRIPFEKLFLIELDKNRANALEKRLKQIGANFEILNGDCNIEIDKIITKLKYGSHYLAFIDCEGLEVKWETMEKILKENGDIIFNFQTQEIQRVWGQWKSKLHTGEKLTEFFGDETWKNANSALDLLKLYKNKIRKYRQLTEDINVCSKNFHYNLIFAVKETKKKSPWFEPVLGHLKKQTEKHTAESVKLALDILAGRSTDLESFVTT